MSTQLRRWRRCAAALLAAATALAVVLGDAPVALAATAPPAVSHLRVEHRYDHTLVVSWWSPAAAYGAGAGVVVRWTRGHTAAASPNVGYAAIVARGRFSTVTRLTANVPYTFSVWVHDGSGHYSKPTHLTTTTLVDVTAPGSPVLAESGNTLTAAVKPVVTLTWTNPVAPDLGGVQILRNTQNTWTGARVLASLKTGTSFVDTTPAGDTKYFYYLAEVDTSGHRSRYEPTVVTTFSRRLSGTVTLHDPTPGDTTAVVAVTDNPSVNFQVFEVTVSAGTATWQVNLHAGKYAVCVKVIGYVTGCWTPAGTVDEDETHDIPAAAEDAVDLTTTPALTTDVTLHA
jgi:hypothetical protein